MIELLVKLLINAFVLILITRLVPGFQVDSLVTAIVTALLLGLVNTFIKPVVVLLTLPINVITLGLFTFVINAVILLVVANLVSGFSIQNFGTALIAAIILSIINGLLALLTRSSS